MVRNMQHSLDKVVTKAVRKHDVRQTPSFLAGHRGQDHLNSRQDGVWDSTAWYQAAFARASTAAKGRQAGLNAPATTPTVSSAFGSASLLFPYEWQ
jgi:hypothetical protein